MSTLERIQAANLGAPGDVWADALGAWLYNLRSHNTRRAYAAALGDLLDSTEAHPAEVTESDLIRWRGRLERRGYAAASISARLAAVSSFYQFAMRRGLIDHNPAQAVRRPVVTPYGRSEVLDVASGEDFKFLAAIDRSTPQGARDYALCLLMLTSGARISSALGANWSDFGGGVWVYRVKGGDTRRVTLPRPTLRALAAWGALQGTDSLRTERPVFTATSGFGGAGRRLSARQAARLIEGYGRAALGSDRHVTPHMLRHTAAMALIESGAPVTAVSALLGHSSMRVTAVYVQHLSPADANKAAEALGARYGPQDE